MHGLPSRVKTHQRHSDPGEESSADTQEVLLTSRCALFGLPLRLPARRLARPPAMQDIDAIGMPVRSLSGVLQDVRMIGRQFKCNRARRFRHRLSATLPDDHEAQSGKQLKCDDIPHGRNREAFGNPPRHSVTHPSE